MDSDFEFHQSEGFEEEERLIGESFGLGQGLCFLCSGP